MGGGPAKDHLLIVLPFKEPVDTIEALRKKFSDIDITFHNTSYTRDHEQLRKELPSDVWKKVRTRWSCTRRV